MKYNSWTNPPARIEILPAEGGRALGVETDVAHDLAGEIRDGGKDATGEKIALDFCEPEFDLVEPGGIGGGVMEAHARVGGQKVLHPWGLVGGKVIENDMDRLFGRTGGGQLFQKAHELGAGMARGGFAQNMPRPGVESSVERERAVTKILEAVAFGTTGRERQNGIKPVQGLNGCLFVDTEHRRMLGRVQVKTDYIGGFGLEVGVVAGHIAFQPMRLQSGLLPHAVHQAFADTKVRSQLATRPMGGSIRWGLLRSPQYPGSQLRREDAGHTPEVKRAQPEHTVRLEALARAGHRRRRGAQRRRNGAVALAVGQFQNHPRAAGLRRGRVVSPDQTGQLAPLLFAEPKRGSAEGHTQYTLGACIRFQRDSPLVFNRFGLGACHARRGSGAIIRCFIISQLFVRYGFEGNERSECC